MPAIVTVPFMLPTVVVGAAFLALLPESWQGTATAVVLAHVFFNVAVVLRTVGTFWEGLDPRAVEQARVLGASPAQAFRWVTWPRLWPAVAAASSIVFLFCFTSFGVVLVLAGVAILGKFDWRELSLGRGEWETLVASLFFMGQILWLENKAFAVNRPERLTLVMFVTQALVFTVLAGATAPDVASLVTPWTSPAWLVLTMTLTVFCTLGSFSLMNAWQPKITATEAGLVYCVEPIFGSLMALFLPALFSVWVGIHYANEQATFHLVVVGGLITAANILITLKPPAKG